MCRLFKNINGCLQLILYVIVMDACTHTSVEQDYFDINGKGDSLISVILAMDSTRVGLDCNCVINNKLIFMNIHAPHKYEIYTIKQDSLIFEKNFLTIGRGPNELKNPSFQYDFHKNRMYLYSHNNFEDKFFVVDLKDFNNVYNPESWEKKRLPIIYTRGALGILNDTVFVNINCTKTANMFSLSYASNKDNYFQCLNFKYPGEHPDLSFQAQDHLFFGGLKQNYETLTFVYSCYSSPYMFIFDIINEQIENIRYISQVLPIYKATNNLSNPVAMADKSKNGFDMFQVTKNYIYVGYSNVTWGDLDKSVPFKGYPSYYFDRINVFDWHGNFVKRLVLDQPIYYFTVSQDDSYIYASSIDLEHKDQMDQVLRFKINKQ